MAEMEAHNQAPQVDTAQAGKGGGSVMENLRARRKGQAPSDDEPFYRYLHTSGDFYVVEYCGIEKRRPISDYELVYW